VSLKGSTTESDSHDTESKRSRDKEWNAVVMDPCASERRAWLDVAAEAFDSVAPTIRLPYLHRLLCSFLRPFLLFQATWTFHTTEHARSIPFPGAAVAR
jgi:hypothetical protein